MAWPPPTFAINRTNATPQQDTHPADHNALGMAFNDLVPIFGEMQRHYVVASGASNSGVNPVGPFPNGTVDLGNVPILANPNVPTTVLLMAAWSSAFDSGTPATITGDVLVVSSLGVVGASGRVDPTVAGKYIGSTVFASYPLAVGVAGDYRMRLSAVGLSAGSFAYTFWSTAWLQLAAQ